jgi:hypothetical protein
VTQCSASGGRTGIIDVAGEGRHGDVRTPVKTVQKKFPKTTPESAPQPVADEIGLDDTAIRRNSKVRGGIEVMHIKSGDTFDPYERQPDDHKGGGKRDLRKLSEHIKLMRELEERKKGDK